MKEDDEKFVDFLKRLFIAILNFHFFAIGYSITNQVKKSVVLISLLLASITLMFLLINNYFWLIFIPLLMMAGLWLYNVLNPLFIPDMKFENVILRAIIHLIVLAGVVVYTIIGASVFIARSPLQENLKRLQEENLIQYIPQVYVVPNNTIVQTPNKPSAMENEQYYPPESNESKSVVVAVPESIIPAEN